MSYFPQTLAPNSLVGRSNIGPGPAESLPIGEEIASLSLTDQNITGGANVTPAVLPAGNVTIDCGLCPIQKITNNTAFTITAPSLGGSTIVVITNGASAGAVTMSGFSGSSTGAPFDTTNGHKFSVFIWCDGAGTAGFFVYAHQ